MSSLATTSLRLDHGLPLPLLGNFRRKFDGVAARFDRVVGRQGRRSNDHRAPRPPCASGPLTAWGNTITSWTQRTRSTVSRLSTTAYAGVAGDGTLGLEKLSFRLPLVATLPKSQRVVHIDAFRESDWARGMDLMNQVIREGTSWPFEDEFATMDACRAYFLSHAALCVRDHHVHDPKPTRVPPMLGCFYVKPNFPGRCSHVCNGGFLTAPEARGQGVAKFMGRAYLQVARDVGYRASYFNLVFANNAASVRLWESLGFERVAVLPKAARTRRCDDDGDDDDDEGGGLETAYGYWYDLDALPSNYLSQFVTIPET